MEVLTKTCVIKLQVFCTFSLPNMHVHE